MTLAKENGHDRAVRPQGLYQGHKLAKPSVRGSEEMEMTEGCGEGSICDRLNRGRVAIFIDGANLFYAALQLGIEIDYTKLLVRLTAGSKLLRSFFYTGVDRTNEKQQGFLLWMRRNGYRVVTKELVQLPDGSKKANLDVEIAVDMMTLAGSYDTAVLVSGDGDLAYACRLLGQASHKRAAQAPVAVSRPLPPISACACASALAKARTSRRRLRPWRKRRARRAAWASMSRSAQASLPSRW